MSSAACITLGIPDRIGRKLPLRPMQRSGSLRISFPATE